MLAIVMTRKAKAARVVCFGDIAAYIGHNSKAIAVWTSPSIVSASTAASDMNMVADVAAIRGKEVRNPVYHYVLTWPTNDCVSEQHALEAVQGSLKALGATEDHQWVAALHGDSSYRHVHVVVNRIHPKTLTAFTPYRDYWKLSRYCRESEIRHGWKRDYGLYTTHADGAIVPASRSSTDASINARAADSEAWTGIMSFQQWLGVHPSAAIRAALASQPKTWETVHVVLARFDLAYVPWKGGAAIIDRSHANYRAKASHLGSRLSHVTLEAELGPYEPHKASHSACSEITYPHLRRSGQLATGIALDPRIAPLHAKYKTLMHEWRTSGKRRRAAVFLRIRNEARNRIASHRLLVKNFLAALKGGGFWDATTGKTIAACHARRAILRVLGERLAGIRRQNKDERAAAQGRHRAPPALFRPWLKQQAAADDPAAIQALRIARAAKARSGVHAGERFRVLENTIPAAQAQSLEQLAAPNKPSGPLQTSKSQELFGENDVGEQALVGGPQGRRRAIERLGETNRPSGADGANRVAEDKTAITIARGYGYNVSEVVHHAHGLEGAIRRAWLATDTIGYVIIETRVLGFRLLEVPLSEALRAQRCNGEPLKVQSRNGTTTLILSPHRTKQRER